MESTTKSKIWVLTGDKPTYHMTTRQLTTQQLGRDVLIVSKEQECPWLHSFSLYCLCSQLTPIQRKYHSQLLLLLATTSVTACAHSTIIPFLRPEAGAVPHFYKGRQWSVHGAGTRACTASKKLYLGLDGIWHGQTFLLWLGPKSISTCCQKKILISCTLPFKCLHLLYTRSLVCYPIWTPLLWTSLIHLTPQHWSKTRWKSSRRPSASDGSIRMSSSPRGLESGIGFSYFCSSKHAIKLCVFVHNTFQWRCRGPTALVEWPPPCPLTPTPAHTDYQLITVWM